LLILRDDPGAIHLTLDSEGWANVNNLLTRANRYGFKLTREDLADVLMASENQSFEWDQRGDCIRWGKS
ncbi:MAG: 2-phosphotransferase, partial [Verrucomicrobiota bacterium]